jgi:hypothetical protein
MIGFAPGSSAIHGRPILYADSYVLEKDEPSYVYARHSATVESFIKELDWLFEGDPTEFAELRRKEFSFFLNVGGAPYRADLQFPFADCFHFGEDVRFVRISFPFGDISVEFGPPRTTNDEYRFVDLNYLTAELERPLLGCETTKSEVLGKLMARLHWAHGLINEFTLEHLIDQVAFNPVAV